MLLKESNAHRGRCRERIWAIFEGTGKASEFLYTLVRCADEQEAADYLLSISAGFGPHTPEQWLALSRPLLRPAPDGKGIVLHYDPAIAEPFKSVTADAATSGEAMLWQVYDALTCQVLLLRGKDSDLLNVDTAKAMTERGPRAQFLTWPDCGHAPTLTSDAQIAAVAHFLLEA